MSATMPVSEYVTLGDEEDGFTSLVCECPIIQSAEQRTESCLIQFHDKFFERHNSTSFRLRKWLLFRTYVAWRGQNILTLWHFPDDTFAISKESMKILNSGLSCSSTADRVALRIALVKILK